MVLGPAVQRWYPHPPPPPPPPPTPPPPPPPQHTHTYTHTHIYKEFSKSYTCIIHHKWTLWRFVSTARRSMPFAVVYGHIFIIYLMVPFMQTTIPTRFCKLYNDNDNNNNANDNDNENENDNDDDYDNANDNDDDDDDDNDNYIIMIMIMTTTTTMTKTKTKTMTMTITITITITINNNNNNNDNFIAGFHNMYKDMYISTSHILWNKENTAERVDNDWGIWQGKRKKQKMHWTSARIIPAFHLWLTVEKMIIYYNYTMHKHQSILMVVMVYNATYHIN